MYDVIIGSPKQFIFEPQIGNKGELKKFKKFVIIGMGGSHLAGDLLKLIKPEIDISIHSSYGLPKIPIEDLRERLIIINSYSGNTEEALDAYLEAGRLGLRRAIITVGGKLLAKAKSDLVPFVEMPNFNIQPRSALALNLKSFLKLTGQEETLQAISKLSDNFHPGNFEREGKELASELRGYVPIIYASDKNQTLAYNWKIKLNETGKIPAFYNVFPELNHNEMTGFDVQDSTQKLSEKFYFIFLSDSEDNVQIQKRMDVTTKLYEERGLKTKTIPLSGENLYQKIFNSLTLADFVAYFTALNYGLESEEVPMVEELKKLIAN